MLITVDRAVDFGAGARHTVFEPSRPRGLVLLLGISRALVECCSWFREWPKAEDVSRFDWHNPNRDWGFKRSSLLCKE